MFLMNCQKIDKSEFICSFFLLASRRYHMSRYLKEKIRWVPLNIGATECSNRRGRRAPHENLFLNVFIFIVRYLYCMEILEMNTFENVISLKTVLFFYQPAELLLSIFQLGGEKEHLINCVGCPCVLDSP